MGQAFREEVEKPRRTAVVTEQTRGLILEAAEAEFAERGFAPARLEDIAERVGISRAAVIYHFRDKQALYDAVLAAAFGDLSERVQAAAEANTDHVERIEAVIDAWIECSWERPTLARLFMREAADATDGFRPAVDRLVTPLFERILSYIDDGSRAGAFDMPGPQHLITILAGATTWHATSAHLMRSGDEAPTRSDSYVAYRAELLRVTRLLLGTSRD